MKIVKFEAENVLRLKAVSIEPTGNVVEITGENGAGKSSTLNAIWMALGGKAVDPSEPIRAGEEKGSITLDLGELIVTRTFRRDSEGGPYKHSLNVTNRDGMKAQKPTEYLAAICGKLSFDPLAFTRMDAAKQMAELRRFVPAVDFDAIDRANQEDYEERTAVNRRAKDLRAQAAGIIIPDGASPERVDISDANRALTEAHEQNAGTERRRNNRAAVAQNIANDRAAADQCVSDIAELQERIKALETKRDQHLANAEREQARLDAAGPLPDLVDTASIIAKIENAQHINALVDKIERKADLEKRAADAEAEAEALTKAIDGRKKKIAEAVAAAKMPIDGLTFGDGEVLLNDVPLSQASQAEQIRISVAIAAAMNPKLRIAHIRDGSLLDRNSWKALAEFADANDLQVWVETVESDRPGAVVIEDGRVAGAIPQAAE